jgi:hypothetical protein
LIMESVRQTNFLFNNNHCTENHGLVPVNVENVDENRNSK